MPRCERDNLERLLRSAWARQTHLETLPVQPKPERFSTNTILNIFAAVVALVLAMLTVDSGYPFWWKVGFVGVGTIFVWSSSWYWDKFANWHKWPRIIGRCAFSACFLLLMLHPLQSQFNREFDIALDFKGSPYFTIWRQLRTRYDLSRFRDHLRSLGLDTPASIAPLEVVGGARSNGVGDAISPNKPLFESSITIGEDNITKREAMTMAYLQYVLAGFPNRAAIGDLNYQEIEFQTQMFINDSYWHIRRNNNLIFARVLDRFDDRYFAERLAIRAFQVAASDPQTDICTTLKTADSAVDSESARWPDIAQLENCKN